MTEAAEAGNVALARRPSEELARVGPRRSLRRGGDPWGHGGPVRPEDPRPWERSETPGSEVNVLLEHRADVEAELGETELGRPEERVFAPRAPAAMKIISTHFDHLRSLKRVGEETT